MKKNTSIPKSCQLTTRNYLVSFNSNYGWSVVYDMLQSYRFENVNVFFLLISTEETRAIFT